MDLTLPSNRNQVMSLYSGDICSYSHRTRIVLAEKDISVAVNVISVREPPEEIAELNPDNDLPLLVDRDLVLYNSYIVMEYLDERFPHPPLMPVDPVARAKARLLLYRIDSDWYRVLDTLSQVSGKRALDEARSRLLEVVVATAPLFEQGRFLVDGAISLVDCSIAPVLWRLQAHGIKLPKAAQQIVKYGEFMFARPAFQISLTDAEREMRSG